MNTILKKRRNNQNKILCTFFQQRSIQKISDLEIFSRLLLGIAQDQLCATPRWLRRAKNPPVLFSIYQLFEFIDGEKNNT